MKQIIIFTISILMLTTVYSQKPADYDQRIDSMYAHTVELVSPEELGLMLKNNPNIVLLDTREKDEYKVSHIEGARLVGYEQFTIEVISDLPKDTPIVLYCSLGVRSELIGGKLQKAGYTKVKNLYGGIFDWVYNDLPVVDKKNQLTDKVHTYDENWSKWLLKGRKVY